jgi:RNA polymerase sigma-70 factor (ECF subfamily)
MTPPDDRSLFAALLPALQSPDAAVSDPAWVAFCAEYVPVIRRIAAGKGLNATQVDDITDRVLVKVVRRMPEFRYDRNGSFTAWLRVVVGNAVKDLWESVAKTPGGAGVGGSTAQGALAQVSADDLSDALSSAVESVYRRREDAVRRAMAAVSGRVEAENWQVFSLVTFENLSAKEAADRVGKTVSAVHMACSRIRKMLRAELTALGLGESHDP